MKPCGLALVVCDAIYSDPNGKAALVGLFNMIRAPRVPVTHPRLCVYVSVTEVRPNTRFRLMVENPESGHRVAELQGEPPADISPTAICDFQFLLDNLTFVEAGRYYIQFWADEYLLIQRPFDLVLHMPGRQQGEPK